MVGKLGLIPVNLLRFSAIKQPEIWGVWVQHRSITTPEKIDAVIRRVEASHLNAIFANVFVYGQALYDSKLVPKYDRLDPAFDPLAYLIEQAHQRNIQVHTWLVNGPVGYKGTSAILAAHPDWSLVGPDGKKSTWLNFARPEVGQFTSDLAIELVQQYSVDGIHLDYFRYPGPEWGFDSYSTQAFRQEYGLDLDQLRYTDLPAYATFSGNPLTQPTTAQVLAVFQNGQPAVALNTYGDGQVVLLNWNANERQVAASSQILQRSLNLLNKGGKIYVLRSETNAAEYDYVDFDRIMLWLRDLGRRPKPAQEADLPQLSTDAVLVMPNIYLISPAVAAELARFVEKGGGIIFVDGPTRSIHLKDIQTLTGMQSDGGHFRAALLLTAVGEHQLIPQSQREQDLATYQAFDAKWKAFRQHGLNRILEQVYQRIKAKHPQVVVSVTISSDQERANQEVLQDWSTWLERGYLDRLIPRGFVAQTQSLQQIVSPWQSQMQTDDRIVMGLISFVRVDEERIPKSPEQLLAEVKIARKAGSNGMMLFHLDYLTDEQLKLLTADFGLPGQN